MKFLPSLVLAVTLTTPVFAATTPPATPAPAKPKAHAPAANTPAAPAPAAAPEPAPAPEPLPVPAAPAPPTLKLDDFITELTTVANLGDTDKKEVEDLYVADGPKMKTILNDDTLSPFQKAQQVSDLRNTRNAKIEIILIDVDRKYDFFTVEAKYRVALTELAADGEWVAAAPAPAK